MGEFEIIEKYFKAAHQSDGVELGIGDDCAVLSIPSDQQLVLTTDTLVEKVHFPEVSNAEHVGYRTCATALSDIAAMGGTARWASLALTTPVFDEDWFRLFVIGIERAFAYDNTLLIGGDLTRGPLAITWHITGTISLGKALRRSGCDIGDAIYVSGELGGAANALHLMQSNDVDPALLEPYWFPRPRLALGRAIAPFASSCIDISDGFLGDLNHLLKASDKSGVLELERIPLAANASQLSTHERLDLALNGGDDYELCFTAAQQHQESISQVAKQLGVALTRVGKIVSAESEPGVFDADGEALLPESYQHFR